MARGEPICSFRSGIRPSRKLHVHTDRRACPPRRLTIVGVGREAWSVWRRGRGKTVCARGACPAWSSGPSTSPLSGMSTRRFLTLTVLVGLLGAAPAQAPTDSPSPTQLNCKSGPLTRTFGKTSWYVYGCDDGHSVVVITAPGNPAMPFYFFFVWGPK